MQNIYNKIGTHDGTFHADECMALAVLKIINPSLEIVRTRDQNQLASLDARIDIGFKYNPSTNDYDHHQKEGAGKRENNIPYAAAGLIWKHFGELTVKGPDSWRYVDQKIIQPIDSEDNGIRPNQDIPFFSYGDLIRVYNNNKKDGFEQALQLSSYLLNQIIAEGNMHIDHIRIIKEGEQLYNEQVILINQDLDNVGTWQFYVVPHTNAKYIVYPRENSGWKVRAVPTQIDGYTSRTPFPENWRGLSGTNLEKITNVQGSEFCHKTGFLLVAKDKSSALTLAEKSLKITR